MLTVFRHNFSRARGAILGWGLTLALLGMIFVPFYDSIAVDLENWQQLMSVYPQEILAFFSTTTSFTSPEGFLSLEYFSFMPIVLGIYALLAGSGLLADDEERGILDLVAAQPISRSALFWGRLFAFLVSLLIVLILGYASIMFATTYSIMELDAVEVIIPFASMGGLLVFFAGLALLLSMLLPSRRSAAMWTGIVLVGGFFLNGLANINDTLANLAPFLPLHYYQGDTWPEGLKVNDLLSLLGAGLLFMLIAWWLFVRRDIRVGGEGGWKLKLPRILRRGPTKA